MINEKICNFEISNLLKTKFFNIPGWFFYSQNAPDGLASWNGTEQDWNSYETLVSAPTYQTVFDWFRQWYGIDIDVLSYHTQNDRQYRWVGYVDGRFFSEDDEHTVYYDKHEEAESAAIKYVLTEII
jgi:hypothetical protein